MDKLRQKAAELLERKGELLRRFATLPPEQSGEALAELAELCDRIERLHKQLLTYTRQQ